MKTTSYEISKQLKEAGFEALPNWAWCILNRQDLIRLHFSQFHLVLPELEKIISYDLETILEALPSYIIVNEHWGKIVNAKCFLFLDKKGVGYDCNSGNAIGDFSFREENESLADTAARLLIVLHKKGFVNFNEGK